MYMYLHIVMVRRYSLGCFEHVHVAFVVSSVQVENICSLALA